MLVLELLDKVATYSGCECVISTPIYKRGRVYAALCDSDGPLKQVAIIKRGKVLDNNFLLEN